jgi:conjugal transfer/entry exclusion protein
MIVRALLRGNLQLTVQLETLVEAAETCRKAADKMDNELEAWYKYVMELHEACDATDQDSKSKYQIALSDEKARKVEQDLLTKSIASAEKWVKDREDQVTEMKDLVKEELKNYPTGYVFSDPVRDRVC